MTAVGQEFLRASCTSSASAASSTRKRSASKSAGRLPDAGRGPTSSTDRVTVSVVMMHSSGHMPMTPRHR